MSLFPFESEFQKWQRNRNLSDAGYKIQSIPERNISIEIKRTSYKHRHFYLKGVL